MGVGWWSVRGEGGSSLSRCSDELVTAGNWQKLLNQSLLNGSSSKCCKYNKRFVIIIDLLEAQAISKHRSVVKINKNS